MSDEAGYATPILIDQGGTAQLVAWTPANVCGLDARSGALLWSLPFEVNFGTSIANPIYQDGLILVSSYYEGSQAIRPGSAKLLRTMGPPRARDGPSSRRIWQHCVIGTGTLRIES